MATTIDYALMAGVAYRSNRDPKNRFSIPQEWSEIVGSYRNLSNASGFEAVAFQSKANANEIVISFAGTGPGSIFSADWVHGNIPLASGNLSDQLRQAADYYLQVKASAPAGAIISFTGHSLGGGLASLMAVFFGESAFTFDQAPFRKSALTYTTTDPNGIVTTHSVAQDLLAYLSGETTNGQPTYTADQLQGLTGFINASVANSGVIPNESNVTDINVQGEVLSSALDPFSRIGTQANISDSASGVSGTDLHSQALLTAFLQSNQTADANKALNDVTVRLPDLLKMIFDPQLFYHDPSDQINPQTNFLEHIVRHEAGGVDGVQAGGDAMVTRFTSDLWKIAQDGGLTMSDYQLTGAPNNLSKTLIAFAMQKYYEENLPSGATPTELFTDLGAGSNGIRFDMADVSKTFAAAITANEKLNLIDAKGFKEYFQLFMKEVVPDTGSGAVQFTVAEQSLINAMLPYMRDWYIQAGASGMNATDILNRGTFMLGGTGADNLTGGAKADLLVGNAGDDILAGGAGSDVLIGGTGVDIYAWKATQNSGIDTVLDSDNTGYLRDDTSSPIVITGGNQYGDSRVFRGTDANGVSHLYTYVSGNSATGGDLLVDGAMLIKNYKPNTGNHMGITFGDAVVQANPTTTRDIKGDPLIHNATVSTIPGDWAVTSSVSNGDGTVTVDYYLVDANGYPTEGGLQVRADTLNGSTGNDHILSGGGNDVINASQGGSDLIEAGAGRDIVHAESSAGNNVIIGGTEGDILSGGSGDDRLYADTQIDTATAIAQGNIAANSINAQGDWLAGGAGSDTLVGSDAQDVLMGGGGSDLLIGGAGNDDILGDTNWVATSFNWTVTDQSGGRLFYPTGSTGPATSGAADVIYAGEGDDHVWGEFGNDVIFGDGGADILYGGYGNDIIAGGKGNDILDGGSGSDFYLYNLGDGNDELTENANPTETNILNFGAGIALVNLRLSANVSGYQIDLGNGSNIKLHTLGENLSPFPDIPFLLPDTEVGPIQRFEFADGSSIGWKELVSRGFDQVNTSDGATVQGTHVNDRLTGGKNATLIGGLGSDIYNYHAGNGVMHVVDYRSGTDINTLRFGGEITSGQVRLGLGSFKLDIGNGDEIHIDGFDRNDVFNSSSIDRFEFADGTVLNGNELLARGFDLDGTAGDDVISGTNTTDRINGLEGNDLLDGGEGDDTLNGGAGDDTLLGGMGSDVLDGGTGNDTMDGGLGNDTYKFGRGSGQDAINDYDATLGNADTIEMEAGLLPSDIRVTRDLSNIYLNIRGTSDRLTLENWFIWGDANKIEQVTFTPSAGSGQSGVVWDAAQLEALAATASEEDDFLIGTNANETLQGLGGNDELIGLDGNDNLQGGAGNDTYYLNLGDGQDVISDVSGIDTLAFGSGITLESLVLEFPTGGDVRIRYGMAGDSVLINGGVGGAIEYISIENAGTYTIDQLMIARQYGFAGVPMLTSTTANLVKKELLQGSSANDIFIGHAADTTFVYNRGDGWDNLLDLGGRDTIQFGEGISPGDVSIKYEVDNASPWETNGPKFHVMVNGNVAFSIANGEQGVIERYRFADGTVLTHQGLTALIYMDGLSLQPTAAGKIISQSGDMIIGTTGNDTIYATNGSNTLLIGGKGNDRIQVNENDGSGVANLLFNVGDGHDTINVVKKSPFNSLAHNTTLLFGSGINPNSLTFSEQSRTYWQSHPFGGSGYVTVTDLNIKYDKQGDSIVVESGLDSSAYFEFADGSRYSYAEMLNLPAPGGSVAGGGVRGWQGTDGDDFYSSDVVDGSGRYPQDDNINGFGGNDRLFTGYGNDVVNGGAGDDTLDGGAGADKLNGGLGDDTLIGGMGDDVLNGGVGNDTYQFGYDSGIDLIEDYDTTLGNVDTVQFAAGVSSADVEITRTGNHLILGIIGTTDKVIIQNWFSDDAYKIEQVTFADENTVWDTAFLIDAVANGGNVVLTGTAAADVLIGGAGTNIMSGGAGNDTYVINQGGGVDYIFDTLTPGGNTLSFGAGINPQNVVLSLGSLLLDLGNGDQVHIMGFDANDALNSSSITSFEFLADNTVLTLQELLARGFDLAGTQGGDTLAGTSVVDRITGLSGDDVISSGAGDDVQYGDDGNDTLDGGAGNDYLEGGAGNDILLGGTGNDVYMFNLGDGQDTIHEQDSTVGKIDTLRFGAGIAASDVTFTFSGASLILGINGTTDQVTIQNWNFGNSYQLDRVVFFGGAVWNAADLQAQIAAIPIADGWSNSADGSSSYHTSDGLGNATTTYYVLNTDQNIYIPVNQSWQNSDGSYGNTTFNADGSQSGGSYHFADGSYGSYSFNLDGSSSSLNYNADGSYSTSSNDGHGSYRSFYYAASGNLAYSSSSTAHYDANGNLTNIYYTDDYYDVNGNLTETYTSTENYGGYGLASSSWQGSDGSYGSDIYNADGSSSGESHSADGSYDTYTNDGQGYASMFAYDANGNLLSETWQYSDGSSSSNSYTYVTNGNLSSIYCTANNYDSNGNLSSSYTSTDNYGDYGLTSSSWQSSDGSYGSDTYNADGSSSGSYHHADGSYDTYINDGLGNESGESHDANGNRLSDWWNHADGTYGSDTFNIDGSSSGSSYNTDGSHSSYSNDGQGNTSMSAFDANSNLVGDSWQNSDGSFGSDTYNADGSSSGSYHYADGSYDTYINDGLGNGSGESHDVNGNALSDWWNHADGTYGSDTFNIDGSSSGSSYNSDGTYSNYVDDGFGNVHTSFYDASGNLQSDSWTHANDAPTGSATATLAAGTEDSTYTVSAAALLAGFSDVNGDTLSVANLTSGDGSLVDNGDGTYTITPSENFNGAVSLNYDVIDGQGGSVAASQSYSVTAVNDTPTGTVAVSGTTLENQILTASNTLADADGLGVISYQWQSSSDGVTWADITGATSSSFTLTSAQVGKQVRINASYIDWQGAAESVSSIATAIVSNGGYIVGTAAADVLTGTAGNDVIDGLSGADTMTGGLGNDIYVLDSTGDVVIENASEGIDTVQSTISYMLGANVENLTLTGAAAINATGNTLGNILTGNSANNTLDGGAGVDTMKGGLGNDTYNVDQVGDVVVENAGEGTDTVISNVNYTLGANIENLMLSGAGVTGTGNNLDNVLTVTNLDYLGYSDVLNGGAGADTMSGGRGSDSYYVDDAGDVVIESTGLTSGTDTVYASVSYTLGANVENMVLVGAGLVATGNALNNSYNINNIGNSVTEAAGGGTDTVVSSVSYTLDANVENLTLVGSSLVGTGNELNNTYTISNTGNSVVEVAGGGTDTVISSVNYTLGANIENLMLSGAGVTGTGNNLDNVLTVTNLDYLGYSDVLNGGAGADTMSGGRGSDSYYVDDAGDVVIESTGLTSGTDTVYASVSYTLGANVENMVLVGVGNINATGNTLNNLLTGNSGDNLLNGGAGADTLSGGLGNDILQGQDGNDTVTDTAGANLLNGGAGTDTLTGNICNEMFVGGSGNDTINTGNGADIVAFNRGDGMDVINGGVGTDNTITLGGGIQYADLALSRTSNDLILEVGNSEQITFANWYSTSANYKSVLDLQVMADAMASFDANSADPLLNKAVQNFDFIAVVNAFDQASGGSATFMHWSATTSLLATHLSGSDTEAFGGDLAHQYGALGSFAGMNLVAAQNVLNAAQFGSQAQSLAALPGQQGGSITL